MKWNQVAFMLFIAGFSNAQSNLSGKVVLADNTPAAYTPVSIQQTYYSILTNEQGEFVFPALKPGTYVLTTKQLGYKPHFDTVSVPVKSPLTIQLQSNDINLSDVIVSAVRVNKGSGMAFNDVSKAQIDKQNLGQDIPILLNNLTGVVVNSDAGNGIGYTGIRVRGSDATRVNITINGVPVNDAESQGTFWVNMPDLVSSVNSIQVQRGVGASTNGSGAFGASINLETNALNVKPYAQLISTAGSFNTFRNTLAAGTGLLNKRFAIDVRGSQINSNGYIDRASSLLRSYYISAGYYGAKTVIKAISFNGWEKTYQAWYYVPEDSIKKGNRTFNPAGLYYDVNGKLQYYDNETDNYNQNNNQLHFIHTVNNQWRVTLTGHFTKGKGYYEQFKQAQSFSKYGITDFTKNGTLITKSDMIRRLWLDNNYAGLLGNIRYQPTARIELLLGGAYSSYYGKHFGKIVSNAEGNPNGVDHRYYFNTANKNDGSAFIKLNYKPVDEVNMFIDLQQRIVNYRYLGFNDAFQEAVQVVKYSFFNPKLGISWDIAKQSNIYASVAVANKEPNRDDFVQSNPKSRPRPEQLIDVEAGWRQYYQRLNWGINGYYMHYNDQLVLNGQINNVGAYNRINAGTSYRRGIEIEMAWQPIKMVGFNGNIAFSENKILSFTQYIDSNDVNYNYITQSAIEYRNTDISFSPNVVAAVGFVLKPWRTLDITFQGKHVGRQYLDNTSTNSRSIPAYQTADLLMSYTFNGKVLKELVLTGGLYNLFNAQYITNGYTYASYVGTALINYNNFAPAAPLNFLAGIKLKF